MGIGLGLAVGALVVGVIAAIMFRPNMEGQDMSPATLESFQITTTDEGSVVPWVCGTCRIKTNLLWYGNLTTVEMKEEAGGKGGGGEYTTGFQYYMDLWQSLCLGGGVYGNVTLVGIYIGDKAESLSDITYVFNDGTQNSFPTEPGDKSNSMKGVAHLWFPQYFLGENVSFVPTFHLVISCTSNAPLTHANMTYGVNPAARIYDLLIAAGSLTTDFNLTSFQTAANYWYNEGYAINFTMGSQKDCREWIAKIFTWVDGCLRKDSEDKWYLQAYDPTEASVATLDQEDLIEFTIVRRSWSETYNDFRGNYSDASQAYTRRTVRVYNGANIRLLGYKRTRTIDLTAFTTASIASKRLSEIMRRESYPEAQITFSADLRFEEDMQVGKIITINHEDYGISNADFRITNREINEYDSNLLNFSATQLVETLWDDTYQVSSSPQWVTPSYLTVAVPLAQGIFELPWTSEFGDVPTYIILCARAGQEDGFLIQRSQNGTDYNNVKMGYIFSQYGTLDETYPNSLSTDSIDDSVGILYTPLNEDPVFSSISRTQLFSTRRIAIIGDEIMAFQNVTYEGASSIRLSGVIRGVLNTPISSHSAGQPIWITSLDIRESGNLFKDTAEMESFRIKCLTKLGSNFIDASLVSYVSHDREYNSQYKPIGRVVATRSGSTVQVIVHRENRQIPAQGAGRVIADSSDTSIWPTSPDYSMESNNGFVYQVGGGSLTEVLGAYGWSYNQVGLHTLKVWPYLGDDYVSVSVGAADGEYIGPTISA